MIQKYREIPEVIEAVQWLGGNQKEVGDFIGCHDHEFRKPYEDKRLTIYTLGGNISVNLDEYIIKNIQGEFYPCKSDIFKKTYELVDGGII